MRHTTARRRRRSTLRHDVQDPSHRGDHRGERERIESLVGTGADVVLAHHHHRVLPFEYLEGMPIFWRVGGFVWERFEEIENVSAIAEIVVTPYRTITDRPSRRHRHAGSSGAAGFARSHSAKRPQRADLTRTRFRDLSTAWLSSPTPEPMTRRQDSTAHEAGD